MGLSLNGTEQQKMYRKAQPWDPSYLINFQMKVSIWRMRQRSAFIQIMRLDSLNTRNLQLLNVEIY